MYFVCLAKKAPNAQVQKLAILESKPAVSCNFVLHSNEAAWKIVPTNLGVQMVLEMIAIVPCVLVFVGIDDVICKTVRRSAFIRFDKHVLRKVSKHERHATNNVWQK